MTTTLDHYNRTAAAYVAATMAMDGVREERDAFLAQVRARFPGVPDLRLLDAGSGSGRDTLAFLNAGFAVDAFDGSTELAAHSTVLTGVTTQVMRFEALTLPRDTYAGIWAMASLLHVPRAELPRVFVALGQALRPGGLCFASFKLGATDRLDPRDGRAFTDLDPAGLQQTLSALRGFEVVGTHRSAGADTARGYAEWFAVTLQRSGPAPTLHLPPTPTRRPPSPR
jgi:SAM-dependent methyltransferase